MNTAVILFHLGEAKKELDRTIQDLKSDPEYCEDDLRAAMGHLYHHLNTAWNGRNESRERHRDCAQEDFDAWRKLPSNEELMLD